MDDIIATAEPLEEILPPSKFARRFIAARWVNVCAQCEKPLSRSYGGNKKYSRRYGPTKFFCPGGYCHARYLGGVSNGETEPAPETALPTTSIAFPVPICAGWQVAYDRLQWKLQNWRSPDWPDRAFCRTRAGLEQRIGELIGPEYRVAVAHLPEWHPDVAKAPEPKALKPVEVVGIPETAKNQREALDHIARYQPGPTPGALQGDDVQLETYEDGYPKMPACLKRRR
jgi:hypothetical protein